MISGKMFYICKLNKSPKSFTEHTYNFNHFGKCIWLGESSTSSCCCCCFSFVGLGKCDSNSVVFSKFSNFKNQNIFPKFQIEFSPKTNYIRTKNS